MGDIIQLKERHRHAQGLLFNFAPWMRLVALVAAAIFWHLDILRLRRTALEVCAAKCLL
jgi:hypothetical protein